MKILIDLGHPAHVHYFRYFIEYIKANGHSIIVSARNKEVTHKLLSIYKIPYIDRGRGQKSIIGKSLYLFYADYKIFKIAKKFSPDIFLSYSSPYAAQVSSLFNKPHISLDDTDIAGLGHKLYTPFTQCIISPLGFNKSFGSKHIIIDSIFDLFYLAPKYFKPDINVKQALRTDKSKKTVFLRFTSMTANHDWKYKKITNYEKYDLVDSLKENYNIIISSEDELPSELKKYRFNLHPSKLHDVLYLCDLFIGESGAMSTEAAILGVPSINMTASATEVGVFKQLINHKMLHLIQDSTQVLEMANILLSENKNNAESKERLQSFIASKVDLTAFLVWFTENYPNSLKQMKEQPDIQYNFKFKQ